MSEETSGLFAEERRRKILSLLYQQKRVLAKELAERFNISVDTIRRDLTIMEDQGLLQKTHGGAIPVVKVRQAPSPPEERYGEGSSQGNSIAKLAVSYIRENDTIFIGSGSLSYLMLKFLPENMPLTVVTNCMWVAEALREREWIDTYLIGGLVKTSGNITDALALEFISKFKVDIGFVTGKGVSDEGIFVATPEVASLRQAIFKISRRIIVLASPTTIGNDGFAKIGSIEDADLLITSEEADEETISRIMSLGVNVITSKTEENDNGE